MANSSATGGYLTPATLSPPLADLDLDAEFQKLVVGVTGLAGQYVRPRWQPVAPKQPEPTVNWCAISVTRITPDAGPVFLHDPTGNGSDHLIRHEDISVLATFYGPQSQRYALALRDGCMLPQNNEGLNLVGISFVNSDTILPVPELVNQQWIRRYDIRLNFRRVVNRDYAILNILSAPYAQTGN